MFKVNKNKMCLVMVLILSMVISLILPAEEIQAFPGNFFWFPKEMHVRIKHPASGLYLGIEQSGMDSSGNSKNGARLQLQKYDKDNPLQIFYLKKIAGCKWSYTISNKNPWRI